VGRAFVVVLALLAAGCGDGNGGQTEQSDPPASGPSGETTASVESATPTPPSTVADVDATSDPTILLDEARETYGAPGSMAYVDVGGAAWFGTSGTADLEGAELTPTTRFRIASVTKSVVAFLVVDAVSRGELSLDDVVSRYVGEPLRAEPPITVRMLLDHTSGIFNVGDEGDIAADIDSLTDPELKAQALDLGSRYLAGEPVRMTAELYVALAETHERYAAPGEDYHYSNPNYQLAVMVLEEATGSSFEELLRTRLVEPLGLEHTTTAPADSGIPEMHGYMPDATTGGLTDQTGDFLTLGNGGSGGVISTPEDLFRIMQAIVGGDLLPPVLAADMKDATLQSDLEYGLGLGRYDLSCGTFYGHQGSVSGTQSIALVADAGPAGVVVVFNLVDGNDPGLLALAESMVCSGT
jgi:D-alanyl-D-alanine carboxypeptidase